MGKLNGRRRGRLAHLGLFKIGELDAEVDLLGISAFNRPESR
jgi:hypothetical protein